MRSMLGLLLLGALAVSGAEPPPQDYETWPFDDAEGHPETPVGKATP